MNKNQNLNGGYIGLVAILLGVCLIIFFLVRTDLFSGQNNGESMIEQDMRAIDAAEGVRSQVQFNSQEASEQ